MPCDKFLCVLRYLHLAKNPKANELQSTDMLYKIRHVLNYFDNKMLCIYSPGQELSLGEAMILWRGHLVFRQYKKGKRHKYGIKLYMFTEPDGFILKFLVCGEVLDNLGGKSHATNIVLHLLQERFYKGHFVYIDNY